MIVFEVLWIGAVRDIKCCCNVLTWSSSCVEVKLYSVVPAQNPCLCTVFVGEKHARLQVCF